MHPFPLINFNHTKLLYGKFFIGWLFKSVTIDITKIKKPKYFLRNSGFVLYLRIQSYLTTLQLILSNFIPFLKYWVKANCEIEVNLAPYYLYPGCFCLVSKILQQPHTYP